MPMKKLLFREERLRMIMETIYEQRNVVVNDLAEKFGKSASSIRLDLAELESRGLISRTHGGAILADESTEDFILNKKYLQIRAETYREEKQRIGKVAADLVQDGDSVMIDGGSTNYFVAKNLQKKRGLTIITISTFLFPILWEIPDAKIYLCGGLVHREFEDTYGDIAMESINKFKPDHTIIGMDGISCEHGLTTTEPIMAMLKRQMISVSKDLIVVSDSSKFGKVCVLAVADITAAKTIVTDNKVSLDLVRKIEQRGPTVLVA
jgi:DeoR/GlpR family transcriptional regulator of sugar metabolism